MNPDLERVLPHHVTAFEPVGKEILLRIRDFLGNASVSVGDIQSCPESFRTIPFGISNTTVLITGIKDQRDLVVRLFHPDGALLGIDRENEVMALKLASSLGIFPKVVAHTADGLLSERALGKHIPDSDLLQDGVIQRSFLNAVRRLHTSHAPLKRFDPLALIASYREQSEHLLVRFDPKFQEAWERYERAAAGLNNRDQPLVPCHNDLSGSNVLWSEEVGIELLDWEYCGLNDPLYDLAKFSVHHNLDSDLAERVLVAFNPHVTSADVNRFNTLRVVASMWQVSWLYLQSAISDLQFNFSTEANSRLLQFFKLTNDLR